MSETNEKAEGSGTARTSDGNKQDVIKNGDLKGAKDKKKGKLRREHIVIGALVLVLAGVLAYFLWPGEETPVADISTPLGWRGTVAVPENIDQLMRDRESPPPGGHYIVTMNNVWTFDRWDVPSSNAYVENEIRNEFTVYFDLNLEEDGRLIYSSPYIPVGATLTGFALDESLPAGEHSVRMTYFLVDENEQQVANLPVKVTLNILG